MAVVIKEPEISERFDLEDIRKIWEYNGAKVRDACGDCGRYEGGGSGTA